MFPPLFSMPKVPVQFVVEAVSQVLSVAVVALTFAYLHQPNIWPFVAGWFIGRYVSELWKRTKLEEDSKRL